MCPVVTPCIIDIYPSQLSSLVSDATLLNCPHLLTPSNNNLVSPTTLDNHCHEEL